MIFVWGSFFLYYKSVKETVDPCYDSFGDQPNLRSSKPITSEMLSVHSVGLIQQFVCTQTVKWSI